MLGIGSPVVRFLRRIAIMGDTALTSLVTASLDTKVRSVRNRQQLSWLWQSASMGLFSGGVVACTMAFANR